MDIALRIALGLAIGAAGTLVGTGGGWALVPLLLLGFHFSPQEAAATSLCVVFLNAASGTAAYMVQRRVRYRLAILFAATTIPGAILGTYVAQYFDRRSFSLAFAIFLLVMSASLFLGRSWSGGIADDAAPLPAGRVRLGAFVSALVGVVSSLLGVGGGIVHVPFLILVLGMAPHAATATSHFVLAVTSLTGAIGYAVEGQVRWLEALTIGGGAIAGAQVGARLARVLAGRTIQHVLAILLCIFAVTLAVRSW